MSELEARLTEEAGKQFVLKQAGVERAGALKMRGFYEFKSGTPPEQDRRCALERVDNMAFHDPAAQRVIRHTRELERFLEKLPIRSVAHLTTPRPFTAVEWDSLLQSWLRVLQASDRQTVAWIRADECSPRRHVHMVLIAVRPINTVFAEEAWRTLVSPRSRTAARVDPYIRGLGGLSYVMKSIDSDRCDVRLSANIAYFGMDKFTRSSAAAERRQLRRVNHQMKRYRLG